MIKTLKHELDKVDLKRKAKGRNWFTMDEYKSAYEPLIGNIYYVEGRKVKVRNFSRGNNVLYTFLDDGSKDYKGLWTFIDCAHLSLEDYKKQQLQNRKDHLIQMKKNIVWLKKSIKELEIELERGK